MATTKEHLTIEQRERIYMELAKNSSFKLIGTVIGKSCTTVSREIRNHISVSRKGSLGNRFNDCRLRRKCPVTGGCDKENCRHTKCSNCSAICCTNRCREYTKEECPDLGRPPYVCNGCSKQAKCQLEKHFYEPAKAQQEYKDLLRGAREGFSISLEEAEPIGAALRSGLDNGHSVYHIIQSHGEDVIGYSSKTIYTYIDAGVFKGIGNTDLPRQVRYRKRKKSIGKTVKVDKKCAVGRSYLDYSRFMQENPGTPVVQMDTVEGRKGIGEKCILTLHFVMKEFMLMILLPEKKAECVTDAFLMLRKILGRELFSELFQLILTDNGSEFTDPDSIETDPKTGELTTRVFYCEPRQSQQKGSCENNHELIRRVIPKGESMSCYEQEDITLLSSHVNSYLRAQLSNKSPYEVFAFYHGEDALSKLGIKHIPPKEVVLKPKLLKKKDEK